MLGDARAEALSTRFAAQWLRLNDVEGMLPDAILHPYYDHTLGEALGLSLDQPPALLHYATGVDAVIWPPREVPASRKTGA